MKCYQTIYKLKKNKPKTKTNDALPSCSLTSQEKFQSNGSIACPLRTLCSYSQINCNG